jgi:hypothetical protein
LSEVEDRIFKHRQHRSDDDDPKEYFQHFHAAELLPQIGWKSELAESKPTNTYLLYMTYIV